MNNDILKKALSDAHIPVYDKNAKQQALKLAMAEFDAVQKSSKKLKVSSLWLRLVGKISHNNKQHTIKNKPYYGGIIVFSIISVVGIIVGLPYMNNSPSTASAWVLYPQTSFFDKVSASFSGIEYSMEFPTQIQNREEENSVSSRYSSSGNSHNKFKYFKENSIKQTRKEPTSTFSIDVDTASYSWVRQNLGAGNYPPRDSIRTEEMVNYFDYAWPAPQIKAQPFKSTLAVTPSPWKEGNKLIHIGIKGYDIELNETPRANLVFLLDVSGSMEGLNKLPLVKKSLRLLLNNLKPEDSVAIVIYAGASGTILEPTKVKYRTKILIYLEKLSAGGFTAGAQGIQLAYDLAAENFDTNAVNRIILATDGDFNVGITSSEALKDFIAQKRKSGIFLSILGFGMDNFNDELMQTLAQNGNGTAAYIDTLSEARKILVEEASGTLFTIAKDVKIQVEFNPEKVAEYRLVGYESRVLQQEDFNNDKVDAGEIGSGHTLTAIYEIMPKEATSRWVDDNRYKSIQEPPVKTDFNDEYAFLKIRYKLPDSDTSTLVTTAITRHHEDLTPTIANETGWATAVAGFAQLLKDGKYTGKLDYQAIIDLAQKTKGEDRFGYRAEFINLVRLAQSMHNQ